MGILEKLVHMGITPRSVQILCAEGKICGVTKFGKAWAIPVDVEKPTDNRVTSGQYKNWRNKSKRDNQKV